MTYFMGYAAQRERLQFMERSMRGKERAARDGRMPATGGVGPVRVQLRPGSAAKGHQRNGGRGGPENVSMGLGGYQQDRIACMLNERTSPPRQGNCGVRPA